MSTEYPDQNTSEKKVISYLYAYIKECDHQQHINQNCNVTELNVDPGRAISIYIWECLCTHITPSKF